MNAFHKVIFMSMSIQFISKSVTGSVKKMAHFAGKINKTTLTYTIICDLRNDVIILSVK